jgi:hypothetical protein
VVLLISSHRPVFSKIFRSLAESVKFEELGGIDADYLLVLRRWQFQLVE